MNIQTLEKLASNPHYKLSAKQKEELEKNRRPIIQFGTPPVHNMQPIKHPTLERKRK